MLGLVQGKGRVLKIAGLKTGVLALACGLLVQLGNLQAAHAGCPPPLQAPGAEQVRVAQQAARNRGFLWKISKAGRSSYIYGTIHIAKFEWMFPGPDVVKALRSADTIALELNLLDQATVNSLQQGMQDDKVPGTQADGSATVPAEFTAWVRQQAQDNCLDMTVLATLRPEFQVALISTSAARKQGLEIVYGIDLMLTQVAKSSWKPLEALESAQDQLDAIRSESKDLAQAASEGAFTVEEAERSQKILMRIANAWASSDFNTINSYAKWCECMDSPVERQEMQRLVDDRNPKMAQRIDSLHADGRSVFAAVGALHLIGEKGLPALLAKKGYTVQRIF